ncbi:hypothetical protein [Arthrobacter castelli]|uniref:hypothetical protein n=1 Tax=Arthrobacter castelli TaxID=271431 RepID=UPI00040159F8|nr:hypothetical protein [Arthrobacter castelli]
MKTPEQLSREVIDAHYGVGTEWEEPNQHGEENFTRAQAESDIDADDIRLLIEEAVEADRQQIRKSLDTFDAVPGFRPFPLATVDALIEAYEAFDGDVDGFISAWNDYTAGLDFPCPEDPAGIHDVTYGSCDQCGDKNRN